MQHLLISDQAEKMTKEIENVSNKILEKFFKIEIIIKIKLKFGKIIH